MSKVFEALQRLERESGRLPSGVSSEAQKVFENGAPSPDLAAAIEQANQVIEETLEPAAAPPAQTTSRELQLAFSLERLPVDNVQLAPASRIVPYTEPDGPGADRFRLLRMRLNPLWEAGKLKTLLITSAHAQDGKSTVALNVATVLAEHGHKNVLVLEGDLCHPSLAHRLGLQRREGLAECLESGENPMSLVRRILPVGWYFLPAGHPHGNPTELLQTPDLARVFDAVRPYFDWILIDTPPVIPLTDTLSLRKYADASLLVVRAGRTPRSAVELAVGRVGTENLLGILLNGSEDLDRLYSDYHRSYGGQSPRKGRRVDR